MSINPDRIAYKTGYKHQLAETALFKTSIKGRDIRTQWIELQSDGLLTLTAGYAWDGASGPTIDDDVCIHVSLIHDALYQLIRLKLLPHWVWKEADKELERHVMRRIKTASWARRQFWKVRVKWFVAGLRLAKGKAARSKSSRPILWA